MSTDQIAAEAARDAANSQSINDNYTPEFLEIFFKSAIEKAMKSANDALAARNAFAKRIEKQYRELLNESRAAHASEPWKVTEGPGGWIVLRCGDKVLFQTKKEHYRRDLNDIARAHNATLSHASECPKCSGTGETTAGEDYGSCEGSGAARASDLPHNSQRQNIAGHKAAAVHASEQVKSSVHDDKGVCIGFTTHASEQSADTKRLDWLDVDGCANIDRLDRIRQAVFAVFYHKKITIRTAIDAAMSQIKEKE